MTNATAGRTADTESRPAYLQSASASPQTPEALLGQIAAGDRDALAEFYDITVGQAYALARMILRNVADAEEAVCDTYTQVWQRAGTFDAARASPIGWLLMICRSRALDQLRQRKVRERTLEAERRELGEEFEAASDELLEHLQAGSRIHAALATLTPLRRELVALAFLNGMSHEEIAATRQLALGTVKSHIRRALTALRTTLEQEDGHE